MTKACSNGCHTANADNQLVPVRTIGDRTICDDCVTRLERRLTDIPERYELLPEFLLPTTDVDKNPETTSGKRLHAPVPVRVPVLDLLDTRRGRRWLGTDVTEDRRGTIGTLYAIGTEIRAAKNITPPPTPRIPNLAETRRAAATTYTAATVLEVLTTRARADWVSREARLIHTHAGWVAQQDWASDSYKEIEILHRQLGDAVGEYPPRPVGRCPNLVDDPTTETHEQTICRGPLLPIPTGVRCPRCRRRWGHIELRWLGRQIGATA